MWVSFFEFPLGEEGALNRPNGNPPGRPKKKTSTPRTGIRPPNSENPPEVNPQSSVASDGVLEPKDLILGCGGRCPTRPSARPPEADLLWHVLGGQRFKQHKIIESLSK